MEWFFIKNHYDRLIVDDYYGSRRRARARVKARAAKRRRSFGCIMARVPVAYSRAANSPALASDSLTIRWLCDWICIEAPNLKFRERERESSWVAIRGARWSDQTGVFGLFKQLLIYEKIESTCFRQFWRVQIELYWVTYCTPLTNR